MSALLGVLMIFAAGAAAQQPAKAHLPVKRNGAYTLQFQLELTTALPDGATITCQARIVPQDRSLPARSAAAPAETATGTGMVNGKLANCAVEIPFVWTVDNARAGVRLSYEIVAVAMVGPAAAEVRASAPVEMAVAYPPAGGVENLSVNMAF
ncbi:MAG TPA: hypothetical protein VGR64_06095 [Terracidiphilus sp.]|nr:hypothetical protein [Terracidiphilus sp.]